jgi:hypothetical protein
MEMREPSAGRRQVGFELGQVVAVESGEPPEHRVNLTDIVTHK